MAANLLEEMETNSDTTTHSSATTIHTVAAADVISYNVVIHAWARCGSEDSGERAEKILRRMERRAQQQEDVVLQDVQRERKDGYDTGNDGIEASTTTMTVAKVPILPTNAKIIVHPNTRTYSSVIDAWSRSNHPTAAKRAQQILNEMEQRYAQTGDVTVRPNTIAYSTVINAHARSRDMERKARSALGVLKKMESLYRSGENVEARPTIVSYNSVLNACASTYGLGGDGGIDEDHGMGRNSKNDPIIADGERQQNYHQLLVLDIVKRLYHQILSPKSEIRPDHFTYGTVLKACANLTLPRDGDDETLAFIRQVFSRCCEDGQVSFGVCFQLRQAVPTYLYRELIPPEAIDATKGHFIMSHLPPAWTRNVKEKKRFVGKKH